MRFLGNGLRKVSVYFKLFMCSVDSGLEEKRLLLLSVPEAIL